MKFSVITVAFNSRNTIEQTINSVLSQKNVNIEYIIVDGGSTDGTAEYLRSNARLFSCLISEPDKGIYDAMNKGIRHATGDVISFLNSDDQYIDNKVLTRVAKQMQEKNYNIVYGDVVFFNKDNPEKFIRHYRSRHFRSELLAWGWMPPHPSLFMRREIYLQLRGFKSDYQIAGDFELIVRAFTTCQIKYKHIPEILVKMQTGGVSTASGFRGRILHNKELLKACRENNIPTNIFKLLLRYPYKLLEYCKL
jgi:glycosyltransferase involved in cell wall biosynthesis